MNILGQKEKNGTEPKKSVAVFDIDGTFFRSSLLIELVEMLIKEGLFPKETSDLFQNEYDAWVNRKGAYEAYIRNVVTAFRSHIKGISADDMNKISDNLLKEQKNKTYRFTRDLIKELQDSHFMLAISHSPHIIVEPFAHFWGFDKVYAKLYSLDENGIFTGDIDHDELIMQKDKILARAVEKENLTLNGSVGVGDTGSDASFLSLVDRPIAFNPNSELYKIARKEKWGVVVERKDVVYTIQ